MIALCHVTRGQRSKKLGNVANLAQSRAFQPLMLEA